MIAASQKLISLAISEKLNSVQHLQVCHTAAIDFLITELEPTDEKLVPYAAKGLQII